MQQAGRQDRQVPTSQLFPVWSQALRPGTSEKPIDVLSPRGVLKTIWAFLVMCLARLVSLVSVSRRETDPQDQIALCNHPPFDA